MGTPYHAAKLYPDPRSSVGMRRGTDTQTAVANIHFASAMPHAKCNQAQSEYKHSLTFRVRRYVVIETKPMHGLQIRPIVHNYCRGHHYHSPSYSQVRGIDRACGEGQTETQTAVTNIHFASATLHAKCN